ncbi:Hsp70 family protein [Dactylosporangium sp. NPDC051541]|uniref:WD40 domain-containing protein n=1 Tax=Dactylosporangium sp. NPDC051541 TaxID=3363977 RepID=UPI0037AAA915
MSYRLGIDLGTSTTVAVLAGADGSRRALLFDASPLLSSAVFASGDGGLLTGRDAERAAAAHPEGLEANPKRRIDDGTVWLGEREFPVVEVLAAVLSRVADEARRVAGEVPRSVVLTHPAAWGRARVGVLLAAAARAGLGVGGTVAEPVAAAAYFVGSLGQRVGVGRHVVVFDLGAGTFDVSVVRRADSGFEVLAADGLNDVGGLDLDAVVVAHAQSLTGAQSGVWGALDWPQTLADRQARQTLWSGARAAKEQLSRHSTADLYVPLADTVVHVTRDEFEGAARAYLDRTVALTVQVLREAGVGRERIDGVFLVGGSSRIPLAATLLHRALRISPTIVDMPELVVAEGCLQATPVTGGVGGAEPPARGGSEAAPESSAVVLESSVSAPASVSLEFATPPGADVAFDPTGALLAVAAEAGVQIWRADGVQVRTLRGHVGTVAAVAWSPDGSLLASAAEDNTVRLWRTVDAGLLCVMEGHEDPVRRIAWAPDGRLLATAGEDHTVRLWRSDGSHERTLTGYTDWVRDVRWSPDGYHLATASTDGTAKVWRVDGTLAGAIAGHTGAIWSVAWSPDGGVLATGGTDRRLRLWRAADGHPLGVITGHTGGIGSVAWAPSGQVIATASADHSVRLWMAADGRAMATLTGHAGEVRALAWSPDGRTLATAGADRTVRVWNVADGSSLLLTAPAGGLWTAAWSPDGAHVATAGADGVGYVWQTADGIPRAPLAGHRGPVRATGWSPDGRFLATGGDDRTVRVWQADAGRPVAVLTGHTGPVWAVAWSPDARYLATGSVDRTVRLWEAGGRPLAALTGHLGRIWDVAWSPDQHRIASASTDNTVRVWRTADGEQLGDLFGHTARVASVAWSPDGGRLATASGDRTARIWSATDYKPQLVIDGHAGGLRAVTWSPDGTLLATASEDRTARIWAADGTPVHILDGHLGPVWSASWAPDGRHLATAGDDHTLRIWRAADGASVATVRPWADGWAVFYADGRFKRAGAMRGEFWWAAALRRYDVGQLPTVAEADPATPLV